MKLAILRIRGKRNVDPRIRRTLEMLRLTRPNHCVVIEDSPQNLGMLNIVKDYVAFGPIDETTLYSLLYKRGMKGSKRLRTVLDEQKLKEATDAILSGKKTIDFANPVFRLSPPSKGYKDIKRPFPEGDLGRREDISALLRKMI